AKLFEQARTRRKSDAVDHGLTQSTQHPRRSGAGHRTPPSGSAQARAGRRFRLSGTRQMNSRAMVFGRWLMLSIGIACLAGCGIKTRPRAPEDVRPEQILDLRATSVADGIQLAWTRPD